MTSGGHTYSCGHIKYCGDHVQMVKEPQPCHPCSVVRGQLKQNKQTNGLAKKIVDALVKAGEVKITW